MKPDNKFVAWLNKLANDINNVTFISAIKEAFYSLIPIVITGAFATLFSSMVFDDTTGLAKSQGLALVGKPKTNCKRNKLCNFEFLYYLCSYFNWN